MPRRGITSASPAAVAVEKEPFHRLIFTNGEVQVLDVVIAPRATTLFHTHEHDLVGVTISPAPLKNEVQGQNLIVDPPEAPGEVWFQTFPRASTHRLENLGTTPIHYVVFQLLGRPLAADAKASAWPASEMGKVVFENARARVLRIDLAAGQESPVHEHSTGYGLVTLTGGRLEDDKKPARRFSEPGFVRWGDPSSHHTLRNAGDAPISILEFEIRN